MNKEELRNTIFGLIQDTVSNFLYYDREEDEDLPVGKIEECIDEDLISVDEMILEFKKNIESSLNQ